MKIWTSTTGRIDLEMTAEQAAGVHHSGQCDADVLAVSKVPAIARQLAKIDATVLREVLSEYGFEELADHKQNLQRLIWLAGCDIDDSD